MKGMGLKTHPFFIGSINKKPQINTDEHRLLTANSFVVIPLLDRRIQTKQPDLR